MSRLGDTLSSVRGTMSVADLAHGLIQNGFHDTHFTTEQELAKCLDDIEAGKTWPFEGDSKKPFCTAIKKCLGQEASMRIGVALARGITGQGGIWAPGTAPPDA